MDSTRRRTFLKTAISGTMLGVSGCLRFIGGDSTSTPAPVPGDASFGFDYSDGSLTIRLTGGGPIPASNLVIRSSDGTQVHWHELGSTAVPASGSVTSGDTATIGSSVLNWPSAVERSETIRVVFMTEGGSPTTLSTFEPSAEETPRDTETPSGDLFSDEFNDNSYSGEWEFFQDNQPDDDTIRETGGKLVHISDSSYNNGATLHTIEEFPAEGIKRIEVQMKTRIADYWGYGFGVSFDEGGVHLKEHKWEGYDRFGVSGVEDHPPEYDSDYDDNYEKYDDTHFARVEPATTSTEFINYSMTVDFDSETLVSISRDGNIFELNLDMQSSGNTYQITIGDGRGHEVEYEYIHLHTV